MLVLTRKPKEEIRIGDDIVVTIIRVRGNLVRVGIDAPENVRIMRSELVTDSPEAEPVSTPTATATTDEHAAHREPRNCQRTTENSLNRSGPIACAAGLSGSTSFSRVVARRRRQRWTRLIDA